MGKKLGIVVFWLVDEAEETSNQELEEEIKKEVEQGCQIPWVGKLEKVIVLEVP